MKNYLKNYWPFLLLFIIAVAAFCNAKLFLVAGTLLYVPVLAFGAILLALGLRSIFNKDTTWPYVNDGDIRKGYDADFKAMPKSQKVWLTAIQVWVYLIFIALIILAAMG